MPNIKVFNNIPKTAGTPFLLILSNYFAPALSNTKTSLDVQNSLESFKLMNNRKKHNHKLIKGHITLNLYQELPHQNTNIYFLRNPIDHFNSHCFLLPRNYNYYGQVNDMNSIDEFIGFRIKNNQAVPELE